MIYIRSKRVFDLVVAFLAIVLLLPLMIVVALVVKFESEGSVIYRARRVGQYGVDFNMWKFRTMVINAEEKGGVSTSLNDCRLTRIGRILRKYKLDELPQFLNIILGQMSLVGPRPQVKKYTDLYEGELLEILTVRPGLTDFASVYFSDMDMVLDSENPDEYYEKNIEPVKNQLRLKYVYQRSFATDLEILSITALQLIGLKKNMSLKKIHD